MFVVLNFECWQASNVNGHDFVVHYGSQLKFNWHNGPTVELSHWRERTLCVSGNCGYWQASKDL